MLSRRQEGWSKINMPERNGAYSHFSDSQLGFKLGVCLETGRLCHDPFQGLNGILILPGTLRYIFFRSAVVDIHSSAAGRSAVVNNKRDLLSSVWGFAHGPQIYFLVVVPRLSQPVLFYAHASARAPGK